MYTQLAHNNQTKMLQDVWSEICSFGASCLFLYKGGSLSLRWISCSLWLQPPLPQTFWMKLNLWLKISMEGKRARMKWATLQRPESGEGPELPGLKLYHWAFQVQALRTWADKNPEASWSVTVNSSTTWLQELLYIEQRYRASRTRGGSVRSHYLCRIR